MAGEGQQEGGAIVAPMPAKVLQIRRSLGQTVEQGDIILVLEAMKMEQEMRAPRSGRVTKVAVREGDSVGYGDTLMVVE
jgi:oxaloacetate decarboxylase alpha subunit